MLTYLKANLTSDKGIILIGARVSHYTGNMYFYRLVN